MHQFYSPIQWGKVRGKVTRLIAERRSSKEGQSGLQAFLDKRAPTWSVPANGSTKKI